MSAKFFLDTNILIYTFDRTRPAKNKIALQWVEKALNTQRGVISYQVVQEFLNVATRKFKPPLTAPEAKLYLKQVLHPLCEVYASEELYQSALMIQTDYHYGFYDELIFASAIQAKCKTLYTEDLQSGQTLLGVKIQNPF